MKRYGNEHLNCDSFAPRGRMNVLHIEIFSFVCCSCWHTVNAINLLITAAATHIIKLTPIFLMFDCCCYFHQQTLRCFLFFHHWTHNFMRIIITSIYSIKCTRIFSLCCCHNAYETDQILTNLPKILFKKRIQRQKNEITVKFQYPQYILTHHHLPLQITNDRVLLKMFHTIYFLWK